jgi:hypothetical protein
MECCGIRAGDTLLADELGMIMRSPAWTTRQGYVSSVRYTHYSLLRTIEAALGLGTLTQNDRFAQPVNDIFSPDAARGSPPPTTWVANYGSATFTPVNLASRKACKVIPVGTDPAAVAVTPNGRMIYVADEGSSTVTPIDIPTNRPCTDHHRRWPASHRLGLGGRDPGWPAPGCVRRRLRSGPGNRPFQTVGAYGRSRVLA